MKKWRKITAVSLLGTMVAGAFVAYNIYEFTTKTIPDCYAQWASAELVIVFRKERNRMPGNWEELSPYYGGAALHNAGQSFQEIRERIIIDFPKLPELEADYSSRAIPEIVRTTSGTRNHWGGAEPNQLINQEVRK